MLLKDILSLALTNPRWGVPLLWNVVRDRFGLSNADSEYVHLLDTVRFISAGGGRIRIVEDTLLADFPKGSPHRHYKLRLRDSDVRVFREVIIHGGYSYVPRQFQKLGRPPRIIDAGANIGLTTLYLKSIWQDAHVLAIEPAASNIALARWHVETNDMQDVKFVQKALWAADCRLRINNNPSSALSWGIQVSEDPDGDIPAMSMMSVLDHMGWDRVELLKLDVEGAEFPIMGAPNASAWLARVDTIIGEYHPSLGDPEPLLATLRAAGFTVHCSDPCLFLAVRP